MNEKTLVSAAITACVAQLVEQRIRNAQVAGSSPATSSRVLPKFRRDFCFSYMYKSKRGSVGTLVRRRAFRRPTARRAALRPEMSSAFVMRRSPVRVRPQAPESFRNFGGTFAFLFPIFRSCREKGDRTACLSPAPATLLPARPRPCRTPATLPPFRQRCATACPRAPGRRRARYRTRAAPCPPGRWSAADAPCSAPR